MDLLLAAACLLVLAVGHSLLGELKLLGPLLRAPLPPLPVSRLFALQVLRLAWHVTSLAWLGLAALLLWTPGSRGIVCAVLVVSGVATLLAARGAHFAWALFLAGAAALLAPAAQATRPFLSLAFAGLAFALCGLHAGWALGLGWGRSAAVPDADGRPAFVPGKALTLAVAAALALLGLVFLALGRYLALPFVPALSAAAALVFALRTIGDGRLFGLFKRVRGGPFARRDSLLYTPLCFCIATALVWLR
jgi:Protein of unknown function (DUF3995)